MKAAYGAAMPFDLDQPFVLGIATGDAARTVGLPAGRINNWRNRGLLSGLGVFMGATQPRIYHFIDMHQLGVMRSLAEGPLGIDASTVARIAERAADVLVSGLAGLIPRGCYLAIRAAEGGTGEPEVIPPDELTEFVGRWRVESASSACNRLEIVDVE